MTRGRSCVGRGKKVALILNARGGKGGASIKENRGKLFVEIFQAISSLMPSTMPLKTYFIIYSLTGLGKTNLKYNT